MAKDKNYQKLINSQRWLRLRRIILSDDPLCADCRRRGLVTAATEVHHVRPVEWAVSDDERRRLAYDSGNLVGLCHKCHVQRHVDLGRGGGKVASKRKAQTETQRFMAKYFGNPDDPGGDF